MVLLANSGRRVQYHCSVEEPEEGGRRRKRRGGGEDKGRRDQPSHVTMEAISHLCGCGVRGGKGCVIGSVRV